MGVPQREGRQLVTYGTIGLEFGIAVAIGILLGHWLDGKFGTKPWLMLLLMFCGLAAAGRDLYRLVKRAEAEDSVQIVGSEGGLDRHMSESSEVRERDE